MMMYVCFRSNPVDREMYLKSSYIIIISVGETLRLIEDDKAYFVKILIACPRNLHRNDSKDNFFYNFKNFELP